LDSCEDFLKRDLENYNSAQTTAICPNDSTRVARGYECNEEFTRHYCEGPTFGHIGCNSSAGEWYINSRLCFPHITVYTEFKPLKYTCGRKNVDWGCGCGVPLEECDCQCNKNSNFQPSDHVCDNFESPRIRGTCKGDPWAGNQCMMHVQTKGQTCKSFCQSQGSTCVRAMDNTKGCLRNVDGHNRKTTAENGCLQNWNDQLCVCSPPRPPTPRPTERSGPCPPGYYHTTWGSCAPYRRAEDEVDEYTKPGTREPMSGNCPPGYTKKYTDMGISCVPWFRARRAEDDLGKSTKPGTREPVSGNCPPGYTKKYNDMGILCVPWFRARRAEDDLGESTKEAQRGLSSQLRLILAEQQAKGDNEA